MIRHLIALGLFSITASGCGGSGPQAATLEPPPPRIEPELARESRLVDPRADALVRQMSDRLARVDAVALEAEEVVVGGAAIGAADGAIAGGGQGAAHRAAAEPGPGASPTAPSSVTPAVDRRAVAAGVHLGRAADGRDHDERGG